jgi:hypothetical protein
MPLVRTARLREILSDNEWVLNVQFKLRKISLYGYDHDREKDPRGVMEIIRILRLHNWPNIAPALLDDLVVGNNARTASLQTVSGMFAKSFGVAIEV